MRSLRHKTAGLAILFLLQVVPVASASQSRHDKSVWNYDGGVFFATDGSLPNGVCFRVSGHIDAPVFFLNLKRINDEKGTIFRRGTETLTHFPDELFLSFEIHDLPCTPGLKETVAHAYLTPEMIGTLRVSFYWKRGVDLRAAKNVTELHAAVEPVVPYAANLSSQLPKRFEWSYQLAVPSKDVPLTDSLVMVFRTTNGRIAARVAARL